MDFTVPYFLTQYQGYLAVTFSYIRNHLTEACRVISWFVPPHLMSLDSHIVGFEFINDALFLWLWRAGYNERELSTKIYVSS